MKNRLMPVRLRKEKIIYKMRNCITKTNAHFPFIKQQHRPKLQAYSNNMQVLNVSDWTKDEGIYGTCPYCNEKINIRSSIAKCSQCGNYIRWNINNA